MGCGFCVVVPRADADAAVALLAAPPPGHRRDRLDHRRRRAGRAAAGRPGRPQGRGLQRRLGRRRHAARWASWTCRCRSVVGAVCVSVVGVVVVCGRRRLRRRSGSASGRLRRAPSPSPSSARSGSASWSSCASACDVEPPPKNVVRCLFATAPPKISSGSVSTATAIANATRPVTIQTFGCRIRRRARRPWTRDRRRGRRSRCVWQLLLRGRALRELRAPRPAGSAPRRGRARSRAGAARAPSCGAAGAARTTRLAGRCSISLTAATITGVSADVVDRSGREQARRHHRGGQRRGTCYRQRPQRQATPALAVGISHGL